MDKQLALVITTIMASVVISFANDGGKADSTLVVFEPCDAKFFTESECHKWVMEMSASLPIAKREQGPFGLSQNPGVEKVVNAAPERSRAFENAIGAIKITAVHPSEDKFIVGASEFVEGNIIPIHSRQDKFMAQIVSVRTNSILFRNIKTGEQVNKNLAKAKGVSPIKPIKNMPGVVPDRPNQTVPIILDSN